MKTIAQMTTQEIIINCRDFAGTDSYIRATNANELRRMVEVMEAYNLGVDTARKQALKPLVFGG